MQYHGPDSGQYHDETTAHSHAVSPIRMPSISRTFFAQNYVQILLYKSEPRSIRGQNPGRTSED
jgi:hypothetical protein